MSTIRKLTGLLCFAALMSIPLYADGIFTVPADVEAGQKIVIDGKIDNAVEWGNAVRLRNFQLETKSAFASEQTTAWITHDNDTLYVGLRMEETVLLQASNRDAKFLAKVKPGDKSRKVWDDDSIELRLRPQWVQKQDKGSQFWMIVNANGATDATAPKDMEQDWPSKGKIATAIGDGFWSVEMSFPIRTFFKNDYSADDLKDWTMNFLRFEKNLNEISSFANISGKGHYDTAHYALMTLAPDNALPSIRMTDFSHGALQPVDIEYTAAKHLAGWFWGVTDSVSKPPKRNETSRQAIFNVGKNTYPVQVSYEAKGHYNWFLIFTHSETGKPSTLFRTPAYPASSDIGPVSFQLQNPDVFTQIRFNGKEQTLQAGGIKLMPQLGENILIAKTDSGPSSSSIAIKNSTVSGYSLQLLNWQYRDDESGNWQAADVTEDASGWLTVAAPGTAAKCREFQSKMYDHASSMTWFGESQDISINADGSVAFFWEPSRSQIPWNKAKKRVQLTLLLPEWLTVTGASSWEVNGETTPYMVNRKALNNLYQIENGNIVAKQINGENYHSVAIYSEKLSEAFPAWDTEEINTYLRTRCLIGLQASADAAGKNGQMGYYVTVDDCPEIPQFRPVRCIARLNGRQPQRARFTMYLNQFTNSGSSPMLESTFRTAQCAGITEVFLGNVNTPVAPFNLGQSYFFHMRGGFSPMEADMTKAFTEMPWLRGWANYANLVALNRMPEAWEFLDEEFEKLKKRSPYTTNLLLDYEFPPFKQYSDVSEKTLKVFAKTYEITETPLNQSIIEQKYMDQWVDFRCKELATAARELRYLAERHGLEFSIYGTPSPRWKKKYSIDWEDIAHEGGLPHVYFGGVWDYQEHEAAMKLAEESHTSVLNSVHVCTTDNTGWSRGIIMRRFILSRGGGVLLWYEKGADGDMLQEIAAVTRLASEYETFFQKGKVLAYGEEKGLLTYSSENSTPEEKQRIILGNIEPNIPSLIVYEHEGKFLAIAMNDTDKPYKARILLSKATGMIKDVENGNELPADNEITVTIPRFSYRAFSGKLIINNE